MNIYVKMCRQSPIQKEWNSKIGDMTNVGTITRFDSRMGVRTCDTTMGEYIAKDTLTWLPRQEDWQEIFDNHKIDSKIGHIGVNTHDIHVMDLDVETINQIYNVMTTKDHWDLLWCCFVHKEVYNLEWNCKKDEWVQT
jgi:hypothetical protein